MKSTIIETLHYKPLVLSSPRSPEGSAVHRLSHFMGQGEVPSTSQHEEGSFWGDGARTPAQE